MSAAASGDRLAVWLRRLRWPVMIAWIVAIVLLNPLASGLSKVTNDTASAYLPASAPSTRVAELQEAAAHGPGQPEIDTVVVLFTRSSGLTAADLATARSARAAVAGLAGHVRGLAAPGPPRRSADGQAVAFSMSVTAPASDVTTIDTDAVHAIQRAVSGPASRAGPGLHASVTGSAALNAAGGITSKTQTKLLLAALIIVVIILLLVYRSPLLWLLPLFGAVGAIVVAKAATHGLASAGLTVSSLSAAILTVLVLGAASDYALLLTHRYREELRRHAATEDAMAAALRRTVPTLAASAATVICAMICLLAAQSASLHGLGPVGAVGIATALVAQVTFLPALLLVFGRVAFWPRVPRVGQAGREESRLWSGVGARVARHPGWVTLAAVLLLGGVCATLTAVRVSNDPLATIKGHPSSVTGANLLAEHYGAGVNDPVVLLARPADAAAAATAARATPGVATVAPGTPAGGYASYSVTLSVGPYTSAGSSAIQDLRSHLDHAAPGALVGGGPAIQYDITQAAHHDTWLLFPLVFVVIFLIIAVLLRAIVAPLVLVATTALSFAAAFGLASVIWRYGFGYPDVEAQLPLYIFIFLVALGVDYNIFLSARIREEARTLGTRQGTLRGLGVTGGVITAAGVVMAGTFAALTQLPSVPVAQVGIAVAVGVLLDTLLVRTVLVPATLLTLGERAWWPSRSARPGHRPRPAARPRPMTRIE